jgi:hypothetical protein
MVFYYKGLEMIELAEWFNIPSTVFGFSIGVLVTLLFMAFINTKDEENED